MVSWPGGPFICSPSRCLLLQVLASLQLATDLQLDRLRAHGLLAAARQLITFSPTDTTSGYLPDGILEAAQIPEGNAGLLLGALASAVKQAPHTGRRDVLAKLPPASELESWLRLRKQAGGEFVWEIEGFSGKEVQLWSPEFSVGGYNWSLECYPKGDPVNEAEGHLSLYLWLGLEFCDPGGWQQAGFRKL